MNAFSNLRLRTFLLIAVAVAMMIGTPSLASAESQPTVNLGTTSAFAVLAHSTITNTGPTTITGDVGLFPGTSFTGEAAVTLNGATHITDAVAEQAKLDLVTAYNDAAGRTPSSIPTELGGSTLKTGTYSSESGTFGLTGTLTLDAEGDPNAVFIFQTESTLITASESKVVLLNGARFCRVFWVVGSSATLGTDSEFVGHIFAMESVTANTRAVIQGQLMARTGAVTLDTNTITNGLCEDEANTATLTVIKHVVNDDGGTAVAGDFMLHVKNNGDDVTASPYAGSEAPGKTYTLAAGDYVVSEIAKSGYKATFSGDGDSSGNVTLTAGEEKTIIITNNDISSSPTPVVTVTPTVTGGRLPDTATHLYEIFFLGIALVLAGVLVQNRRKLHA